MPYLRRNRRNAYSDRRSDEGPYTWKSEGLFGHVLAFFATLATQSGIAKDPLETLPWILILSVMALMIAFTLSLIMHLNPKLTAGRKRTLGYISIFSGSIGMQLLGVIVLYRKIGWWSYFFFSTVLLTFMALNFFLRWAQFKSGLALCSDIFLDEDLEAAKVATSSAKE